MTWFDAILALAGLPVLGAALYLLWATLAWRRPASAGPGRTDVAFCVLVPAHNEEAGIGATVRSLGAVDYPESLRRVVVIADNCTDGTADAARAEGAEVIERHDVARRGKGFALQYAIEHLLADATRSWDALVVVDADTVVSGNLLHVMAAKLAQGEQAVQAAYMPRRGGTRAISVITHVAFAAIHLVRSGARERAGLSCGLRGNGMAFRRELLSHVSHTAFSRTEDLEFGIQLGLQGVRVAYAGETQVNGDMPEQREAVDTQRERWMGGRAAMLRKYGRTLFREALGQRSGMLADLLVDLVIPPLSLLTVAAVAGTLLSAAMALLGAPGVAAVVWSVALASLAIHVTAAARVGGMGRAFMRAAWSVPAYAFDKALTAIKARRNSDETWVRTPRKGELL